MRRIHTAATWRESTASLNKTDNTESASGKNPHGSEVERIHNSGNNPPALQSLAWTLLHGVPPAIASLSALQLPSPCLSRYDDQDDDDDHERVDGDENDVDEDDDDDDDDDQVGI